MWLSAKVFPGVRVGGRVSSGPPLGVEGWAMVFFLTAVVAICYYWQYTLPVLAVIGSSWWSVRRAQKRKQAAVVVP